MSTQKRIMVAANWKMHLNVQQSSLLVHRLDKVIKAHRNVEVVLGPSTLALQPVSLEIDRRKFRLAAQDGHATDEGGNTGEVSMAMMAGLVHYAFVGHSARRIYNQESLEVIQAKMQASVRNGIVPILCVGETKHEQSAGETNQVLHDQISTALALLTPAEAAQVLIAYEPVWAISTFDGEISRPTDMQQRLTFVREQVSSLFGAKVGESIRVLYGGSVNNETAASYLTLTGCDGVFVGAASLNYQQFAGIVTAAEVQALKSHGKH